MTKTPGRASERGLVDMAAQPEKKLYVPPPASSCRIVEYPVSLTAEDRLHVREHRYKGRIVDFAIMQIRAAPADEGTEVHIARIDCCRSTIHRHQYDQTGQDVYDHRVIVEIPALEGWDVVDAGYADAYDVMFNEWVENLRRWRCE